MAAQLVKHIKPVYPKLARQARIQGTVRMHAIISKDGTVQELEVISGDPLLVQSALDAVKQWKYRPTLLDGDPVEVDTTIDVLYALNDDQPGSTSAEAKPMRVKMGPPIVANMLLSHPQPVYPQEAKDKKIQGTVRLRVVIGTDGTVMEASAISGDPLLTRPALEAVRQWTYRPTLLNGEPVEVDSEVMVIYQLNGKKTKKTK